ncbi:uncharacterized protein LOC123194228 [Mangifera indica]|uniref:uncharacterized protein LOC123194228 n=1 Tax=Mangifera indica TaxID=29780 RepID=UPI001CFBE57A|nr:uncharacterized protein LOC123194228 [Mangifera indica]
MEEEVAGKARSKRMSSSNFLGTGPPQFAGENYHIWAIKMKAYLMALNLWEAIKDDGEPEPLGADPTLTQIKSYEDRKPRALTCLHSTLSKVISTKIMVCKSPKEVWERLKEEYEGSDRVKTVKLLTIRREFEVLRMKEEELVKEYASKLLELVNKIRLMGEDFPDTKVVEKILVSLPSKFESKVLAIEESYDLKTLSVSELISKLQAYEQRTLIRDDEVVEGAFQAKHKGKQRKKESKKVVKENSKRGKQGQSTQMQGRKGKFSPCCHCQRTNQKEEDCWFKGKPLIQCRFCKEMGHIEKNCKKRQKQKNDEQSQQANFIKEKEKSSASLFMAMCDTHEAANYAWFIDIGCTSHMENDEPLFSNLDKTIKIKVKLGNG